VGRTAETCSPRFAFIMKTEEKTMLDINRYKGMNIIKRLRTEDERAVYLANWEQLYINYGNNVEWQRLKNQIYLCEETKEYLYAVPGPVKYVPGTRPILEAEVEQAVRGAETDRDRVLKILVYCRDLYLTHGTDIEHYYGGTEEDLIEKGENLCECMGRLMVSLCEILGLPGRIVMHITSGHITCEIYVDGGWAYFDPRAGMFYVNENGRFLSVAELIENREYILNQPDWVKEYVSAQWKYEQRQDANYKHHFHPKDIQGFCDYSLMDADQYNFDAKIDEQVYRDGMDAVHKRYMHYLKRVFGEE